MQIYNSENMKRNQAFKDISKGDNKTERKTYFLHENHQTLFSNRKLPIPIHHQSYNSKIILATKQKRKNITNILINDTNTISNISESSNSNNIINNDFNNSDKSKIYQKKRIPAPIRENYSKEKIIGIKKRFIYFESNLNITNKIEKEKYYSFKDIKSEEKKEKLSNVNKNSLSPRIYKKTIGKKIMSINNNKNINYNKKIKKYLYLNQNIYSNNKKVKNKSMYDRYPGDRMKKVNANNYKKLDLFKIDKKNNINNININLNSINNLNNKINCDIIKNINSCRNKNRKFKDINYFKKLNFDQPGKTNLLEFNNLENNCLSNKTLLNDRIEITDRINDNKKNSYKNSYTLNNNSNLKTEGNSNKFNKRILYKIKPKIINQIILTPRNKAGKEILKGENKIKYIDDIIRAEHKFNNINKIKGKNSDNNNEEKICYSIPFQININKNNNKKVDLFEGSRQNINNNNNNNKGETINRINIFVNDGNNNVYHGNKNINIHINNNFDNNIITNDSLTIFNNTISDIQSNSNSNDITQIESVKDEKNNVLSSYQLNLYLNEAKKSNPRPINFNNISGQNNINFNKISGHPIKKALLYIKNSNKYYTNTSRNNNKNKEVDISEKERNIYQRNDEKKKKNCKLVIISKVQSLSLNLFKSKNF